MEGESAIATAEQLAETAMLEMPTVTLEKIASRVEGHKNPFTNKACILFPSSNGNLFVSQVGTEGEEIAQPYSNSHAIVKVISPKTPLYHLEDKPMSSLGSPVYDLSSNFGVDERFKLNNFSPEGLELLIWAFADRSSHLYEKAINGNLLRQFYPYMTFDIRASSLVGRLLASREIYPLLLDDVTGSVKYYRFNNRHRCMGCDTIQDKKENFRGSNEKSGVLSFQNSPYGNIIFRPDVPKDYDDVWISPLKHISNLSKLSEEQRRYIALALFEYLKEEGHRICEERGIPHINIAIHSAPLSFNNSESDVLSRIQDAYHLCFKSSPGRIPDKYDAYEIPGSGLFVVPQRIT